MIGEPPVEALAIQVRPTTPAAVTATLFARLAGAEGTAADLIEISDDAVVLYPNAFLDSILKR